MQLWEGFETTPGSSILVLGATNKKDALDDAVLRRFSLQYEVRPCLACPTRCSRHERFDAALAKGVGVGGVGGRASTWGLPKFPLQGMGR